MTACMCSARRRKAATHRHAGRPSPAPSDRAPRHPLCRCIALSRTTWRSDSIRSIAIRPPRGTAPRPTPLRDVSDAPWRSAGDTVERIELLAARLVLCAETPHIGERTRAVLDWIHAVLAPSLDASGAAEIAAGARRARRQIRRAWAFRRAHPRAAGRAADRAELLFGRHPCRAYRGRVHAGAEGCTGRCAPLFPGRGRVAALGRHLGLGHLEHAHRRRRHRAGAWPSSAWRRAGSREQGVSRASRYCPWQKSGGHVST